MSRRERIARERAAEAAGHPDAQSSSGQPTFDERAEAGDATVQQPAASQHSGWSQQPQAHPGAYDGQASTGPPQPSTSQWSAGAGQEAGQRPVIRRAARAQPATGSGPSHAPQGATPQSVFAAAGAQQPPGAHYAGPAPQPDPQAGGPAWGPPPPAPPGEGATGTEAAGAAGTSGTRRTSRSRKREYEPLGPVRGTIRAFGELCITAGMVLILFVVWQLWWTDIAANRDNEVLADQLVTEWRDNPANELPDDPETPVVGDSVDENSAFGIMYVPRFGEEYYRTIAEGVSLEPVLNRMGMGRYPSSAMPGEVGNFSMAGHRVTYGKPLNQIHQLRPGDEIVIQTGDGFYTYTFRNFEIVLPDATEVLSAVPAMPDYKGKDRIMTLTACNPMFSARERYIAYTELTDWQPASEGAPDSISDFEAFDRVGGEA